MENKIPVYYVNLMKWQYIFSYFPATGKPLLEVHGATDYILYLG